MPTLSFDLKDLKSSGYEAQAIVDNAPRMGIEVEAINGTEITISITPNRPDLLDYVGFVRAMDHFTGKKIPRENFYKITNKPALTINVEKEVKKARPYIGGIVVRNTDLSGNMLKYLINFTDKFAETYGRRRKKIAIGVHDMKAVKGNLTYTAAKNGKFRPLNKQREMAFSEIMAEHEKGLQYKETVGKNQMLPYLKDDEKIIALIPIINSDATRATEKTKDIFIDITGTSKTAISSAASLIAASFVYAGADVYPVLVKYAGGEEQTPGLGYKEIKVSMRKVDNTLGVGVGKHDVIQLVNKVGYVAAKYGSSVLFYIPPYRIDVLNAQDVIEDIAIAYGYDKIIPLPVLGHTEGLPNEISELENRIAQHMIGLGYLEVVNSLLTNETTNFKNMNEKYNEDNYIKIADAKTSEISMVRCALLPGMMKNLSASMNDKMPFRIFEIGRIFWVENGEVHERLKLAIASQHAKANFAEVKSVVESIMKYLEVEYKIESHNRSAFIDGRCARVTVNGEKKGVFGEIHPKVLSNFGLEEPVVAATITLIDEIKYVV